MVRITNSLYHEAYEYIKQDSSLGGNCIIFVASDVDSICAVHIFQVKKTCCYPGFRTHFSNHSKPHQLSY